MKLITKTLEFSIEKTITEEQFITTEFITDSENPFTLISYRKQIKKGVYENVTENADIFDYMYYGSKYKTFNTICFNSKIIKTFTVPENLKNIVVTFTNKMLEEKGLEKPRNMSIIKKAHSIHGGGKHNTDFTIYTLNLVIKLTY